MLIGILSDTHDRADAARCAIEVLGSKGAEFYIHCGDVGGQEVLDELAGKPSAFVWGNNDWDRRALQRYAEELGIACYGPMANLELAGKRFAVIHGDDLRLKRQLLDGQQYDYLLLGHTHIPHEERIGKTHVINPGALYRAREKTVVLLDTVRDGITFLRVQV